jgi:hypothetical protein
MARADLPTNQEVTLREIFLTTKWKARVSFWTPKVTSTRATSRTT